MKFTAPKNFKRGRLISNKYTIADLIIAAAGIVVSLVMEVFFLLNIRENAKINLFVAILLLIPAGIAVLFVVPNGIYHNIFTFLVLKIMNLGQRRKDIYGGIRKYAAEEERQDRQKREEKAEEGTESQKQEEKRIYKTKEEVSDNTRLVRYP